MRRVRAEHHRMLGNGWCRRPAELTVKDLVAANAAGVAWAAEVNGQLHSEIYAVPAERLLVEAPLLG